MENISNSTSNSTLSENDKISKNISHFKESLSEKKIINDKEIDSPFKYCRKYSIEPHLFIKNFVPTLKPIEFYLVPSKFKLNSKSFKDYQYNKNNKILIETNKYFISCPNSEEESELSDEEKEKEKIIQKNNKGIKNKRRILKKIKNNKRELSKISSVIELNKYKKYEKDVNLLIYSSSEEEENDLYDENDFINYSIQLNENSDKNINKNVSQNSINKDKSLCLNKTRSCRINSCSILETLKLSFDKESH